MAVRGHMGDGAAVAWGARAPLDAQLPTQAAQRLAEQSLCPTTSNEDYFGLQNEQTKAKQTHIYSVPLPTASSLQMQVRAQGAPGSPEQVAKGRAQAGGDSPWPKCHHQRLPELHSQPHCTAGSPKGLLTIGWEGGHGRQDSPMGHARPPQGQADTSVPLGPGACSRKATFTLVVGLLVSTVR